MSKSLQDQLLELGLAREKRSKARNPPSRTAGTKNRRRGAEKSPGTGKGRKKQVDGDEVSLDRAYALREREEKKQAEATRTRKLAEDRRRRQLNKDLRAIVSKHRLNDSKAEVPRHFMYRGRIRKINLTPDQLKALNAGELGIAYLSGGYHLLAPGHVEAVRKLSEEHVPDLSSAEPEEDSEYPIPDDLTW
jgi:uncharacterized protein YaiL (DUF2058 family)